MNDAAIPPLSEPPVMNVDLEQVARSFLEDLVNSRYGGNASQAADALGVSRSTMSKVLTGERGLNNLSDWSMRLEKIGVDPREMFGAVPLDPTARQVLSALERLPPDVQVAFLQLLESLSRLRDAHGGPHDHNLQELIRRYQALEPQFQSGLLAMAKGFGSMT